MGLQLYSPKQVSQIINRSTKTVYRYLKKYKVPLIEHRGRGGRKEIFVKEDDLETFILNQFNDFRWTLRMVDSWLRSVQSRHENSEKM